MTSWSRYTPRLRALGELCERLVVVFDEFQRLHTCPGDPLAVIRSALMVDEVEHLLALSATHPQRTQHLAWNVWQHTSKAVHRVDVQAAYEELLQTPQLNAEFDRTIDTLLSGAEPDINELRALFLLASGESPCSDRPRTGTGSRTPPALAARSSAWPHAGSRSITPARGGSSIRNPADIRAGTRLRLDPAGLAKLSGKPM
jgi:hypothetical protein